MNSITVDCVAGPNGLKAALVLTVGPGLTKVLGALAGPGQCPSLRSRAYTGDWPGRAQHVTARTVSQHCTLVNTTTHQHVLRSSSRFLFERNVHFVPLSHPERFGFSRSSQKFISLCSPCCSAACTCRASPAGHCSVRVSAALTTWADHPLSPCCPLSLGWLPSHISCHGIASQVNHGPQCQSQVTSPRPALTAPRVTQSVPSQGELMAESQDNT